MNLGYVPFDVYNDTTLNNQGGPAPGGFWVAGCELSTVRACYQNALENYYKQGIRGVRFQIGMAGAASSTALVSSGPPSYSWSMSPNWSTNVLRFLTDVRNAQLSIAPAFQLEGQQGDVYVDVPLYDACFDDTTLFRFYPSTPFGVDLTRGGVTAGQGVNRAYDCSPAPPSHAFAGWSAIQNVVNTVIQHSSSLGLAISSLELQQEMGISELTVYARLFYDNKAGYNAYQATRSAMLAAGYEPKRVTYSIGGSRTHKILQTETWPFSDVGPSHPAWYFVNVMKQEGVTVGCGNGAFCANSYINRSEMAAFIVRAVYVGSAEWTGVKTCSGSSPFQDVDPNHVLCGYIAKAKELGITQGCTTTTFCPDRQLTWTEMSIFAIRGLQVARTGQADDLFTDYPASPYYYPDITQSHWVFKWIQKASQLGVFRPWLAGRSGIETPHPIDPDTGCKWFSPSFFCGEDRINRASSSFLVVRGVRNKFDGDQFDCYSYFGDSARLLNLSTLFSGLVGGYIGSPAYRITAYGLSCGGSNDSDIDGDDMFLMPVAAATPQELPGVVDVHLYSCKNVGHFIDACDLANPKVGTEAQLDFNAVKDFLAYWQLPGFLAFTVGETHSGTSIEWALPSGVGSYGMVQGFNSSRLPGTFTILLPWGELYSPHGSFPYVLQINPPYYVF